MEDQDEFISDTIRILVDLLKGRDYEEVRRINYLVNLARQDDLKEIFNKLKSLPFLLIWLQEFIKTIRSFWRTSREDWMRYL